MAMGKISKSTTYLIEEKAKNENLPTILIFSESLSLKTLSSEILPISDLIVVCANWVMANSASSTP